MLSTGSPPPAPDRTLAANDPGDETARRYRFQHAWAAIVCCMLFDDTQDVIEVFCEHHEDILLRHRDGTFTGQQVKTRESDQPVWKADDDQVQSACVRFVQLDAKFPGHFRAFRFLTNHPLHSAATGKSLGHVLSAILAAPTLTDLPAGVKTWHKRVARSAEATESVAFQALKKATATADLPKLRDVTVRLVDALSCCGCCAADSSYDVIVRAAHALIDLCARASSLDHEQLLPAYLLAVDNSDAGILARIVGKRMTAELVRTILADGLNATAPLVGDPGGLPQPGEGRTDLLMKKLDAGGFSAISLNSGEDLRDKSDYLGIAWTQKLGRTKGLERYAHVRSIALSDAARAFEATKSESEKFGPAMREDLRRRFRERRAAGEQLFDCSDEHLEGLAYSLTAQCKVLWSTDRPWEVT